MDNSKAPYYNPGPFSYNRMYPPLFFVPDDKHTSPMNIADYLAINSREFYRLGIRNDVTHQTVMNCGSTLGEYSMVKSMEMNLKRIKKSKPTL